MKETISTLLLPVQLLVSVRPRKQQLVAKTPNFPDTHMEDMDCLWDPDFQTSQDLVSGTPLGSGPVDHKYLCGYIVEICVFSVDMYVKRWWRGRCLTHQLSQIWTRVNPFAMLVFT